MPAGSSGAGKQRTALHHAGVDQAAFAGPFLRAAAERRPIRA